MQYSKSLLAGSTSDRPALGEALKLILIIAAAHEQAKKNKRRRQRKVPREEDELERAAEGPTMLQEWRDSAARPCDYCAGSCAP